MKKALLLVSILTMYLGTVFAQEENEIIKKDESTGSYFYEEVVKTPGLKQDELFKRTKAWVLANMKTADNNITFDDQDFSAVNTGAMKIKTMKSLTVVIHDGYFDFKFHVWCKDERYKIRLDNIMFYAVVSASMQGTSTKTYAYSELKDGKLDRHLRKDGSAKLNSFITAFKNDMTKSASEVKKNNDW